MNAKNLEKFISILEKNDELIRIKQFVSCDLEITEIADRFNKSTTNNKALLFENTGTSFPLLINAFGSEKRMCLALGINQFSDIAEEMQQLFKKFTTPKKSFFDKLRLLSELQKFSQWMPSIQKNKGVCQDIIIKNPDLSLLPILKCWPKDGGRYITLAMVNTLDPITHIRNVGMYRMQVLSKNDTGMHWQRHKVGAKHFEEYKKLGKRMPVAVCLGGDPIYTYTSTAPLPEQVDEYILAGFLRKKKVSLVPCITQPEIYVPEDVDFVLEGYVDHQEPLVWEGPFGDHTGFYSLADYYPKFHITAITHKKNAIYPATIVGIPPQEDKYLGLATERIFLQPLRLAICPELEDMHMPVEGVFHNLVLNKIEKTYPGHATKVMNALWGAGQMMFTKVHIISDVKGVELTDYFSFAKECFQHFNPAKDFLITHGPADVLDHSSRKLGFGGKIGFDATQKTEEEIFPEYLFPKVQDIHKTTVFENPLIIDVNTDLLSKNIPCLLVSVQKKKAIDIVEIHKWLMNKNEMTGIKMIVYTDANVNIHNLSGLMWIVLNNIDAERDIFVFEKEIQSNKKTACIAIDGTMKTKNIDGFDRDWPNIVVSDPETINKIDTMWSSLDIGNFEPSPSLNFKNHFLGDDAIATKNT
ncbi:MAG: menaquinone biosynthesis decarboxylase [Chitinophagaceae bacterium]